MKMDIRNIMLGRRDVLKLSAAAVVGPPLVGATLTEGSWLPSRAAAAQVITAMTPRMAIGYWDGLLASSFIDAKDVETADIRLEQGVHLSLAGSYDDETALDWKGFGSVSLSFDLQPFHTGELRAWQYQSSPVTNISSVATLSLPIDRETGLNGWVFFRDTDSNAIPARVPFRLGLNATGDTAKLRSGYYVIALAKSGMGRFVDWDRLRLRPTNGGDALNLSDRDGRAFDRTHIIIEVHPG